MSKSRRAATKRSYLLEDDESASFLELLIDSDRVSGTALETTVSGGLAFEMKAAVGGYLRAGRLSLLFTNEGGPTDFVLECHGTLGNEEVILARSHGLGTVTYRPAALEDYIAAVARILAARTPIRGSTGSSIDHL